MRAARLTLWLAAVLLLAHEPPLAQPITEPAQLAAAYTREVDRRLSLPAPEHPLYASLLDRALQGAGVHLDRSELVLLVDRSANVQVLLLWWAAPDGRRELIGASPVSTGRPSGFEHFETPTGVFDHSLANPDFRAEGTLNEFGIRGYGHKGMRVFDFGWVMGQRAWAPANN